MPGWRERWARRWRRRPSRLFLATVVLPTALAAGYYGLLASDVYVVESRFVVRAPQGAPATGLGALLQGTGFGRAQDDTYAVHDYIRSRDAMRLLQPQVDLRAAYEDAGIDRLSRFPGWDRDRSDEALYLHHLRHLQIDYDSASSITTLTVRAYGADQARAVNEALLRLSEALLDRLNDRSRQDLIAVARREVQEAEAAAAAAAAALTDFRSRGQVMDVAGQSALQLQTVARLEEELRLAQAQRDQVQRLSPGNPQLATLQARIDALRADLTRENARLTGREGSLNAKSGQLARLTLAKELADKQLAARLAELDSARGEARRKHLYLERLVEPHRPDQAMEPRRLRAAFTVFVLGLLAWGVLGLALAAVREHAD
ncbi:hypothetical protein G3A44_19695 [Ideonella sp. TBM-1]|uniref:Lipopolysaccharide biosynthesis protein n=1 Tax=Ideonella livida TaxID=2707176 RepID=A0A7C9TLU0_9BURK|nr:hypothetical protein [Ideonella livida]